MEACCSVLCLNLSIRSKIAVRYLKVRSFKLRKIQVSYTFCAWILLVELTVHLNLDNFF
jgi:hypothetical protein